MLFLVIVVLIGLFKRRRSQRYWMYAGGAVLCRVLVEWLFYADGTLEDPTGDGIVTALVRQATDDFSEPLWSVWVFFILIMVLGWLVPIWMVVTGMKERTR